MIHHGCDHQVDVDPEGVVEHKAHKGEDGEDIADRKTCWQQHGQVRTEIIFNNYCPPTNIPSNRWTFNYLKSAVVLIYTFCDIYSGVYFSPN